MKIKFGQFGAAALLLFVASSVTLPEVSFAQEVENRNFDIGGGGSGSCNACAEDYCGCDTGTFSTGIQLSSWECTCTDGGCDVTCNYTSTTPTPPPPPQGPRT
jgi:hypothetical protein